MENLFAPCLKHLLLLIGGVDRGDKLKILFWKGLQRRKRRERIAEKDGKGCGEGGRRLWRRMGRVVEKEGEGYGEGGRGLRRRKETVAEKEGKG